LLVLFIRGKFSLEILYTLYSNRRYFFFQSSILFVTGMLL
jgi:hypothetical protein